MMCPAYAAKLIVGTLHKKSALIDYQKPMGVLNQLASQKPAALALVGSPMWLPQASRRALDPACATCHGLLR